MCLPPAAFVLEIAERLPGRVPFNEVLGVFLDGPGRGDGNLMGALATTEMALALAGVPHKKGGVQATVDYLIAAHAAPAQAAAE